MKAAAAGQKEVMKHWKNIEIPANMIGLEKDVRGYPVPYSVLRDNTGHPHFQINDTRKVDKCILEKLCAICGQPLLSDMWIVGGAISAFHPMGAFLDPPIHYECGKYALQVCPYLANPSYNKQLDLKTLKKDNFSGVAFLNPTVIPGRPPFFALVKLSGFAIIRPDPITRIIKPTVPYLKTECWKDGELIEFKYALELLDSIEMGQETKKGFHDKVQ